MRARRGPLGHATVPQAPGGDDGGVTPDLSRRRLLQGSTLSLAGSLGGAMFGLAACQAPVRRVRGPTEELRFGLVGCRSQGRKLLEAVRELPHVTVAALCDVDEMVLTYAAMMARQKGKPLTLYQDLRQLFEDDSLDAVLLATPVHWHALATVLACRRGLDVFVECPPTHGLAEGPVMLQTAAAHGRMVQCSLPHRAAPALQQAARFVRQGGIGRVLGADVHCYRFRRGIGRQQGHGPLPKRLDYELWCGPLQPGPLRRRRLHEDWRWQWQSGHGELGETGVQCLDLFRMLSGIQERPRRVASLGGRLGEPDDGETPDTLVLGFDYGDFVLCYQQRAMPTSLHERRMDSVSGVSTGVVLHGHRGRLIADLRAGLVVVLDHQGRLLRRFSGRGSLLGNFCAALRSGDAAVLQAPLDEACASAELMHLGEIRHRSGEVGGRAAALQALGGQGSMVRALDGMDEHLLRNGYDFDRREPLLGTWMPVAAGPQPLPAWPELAALANRSYRPDFALPGARLSF